MLFTNILPEAKGCCSETFNVYVVLVTLFCMCTNFHGHLCLRQLVIGLFIYLLPEAICYCLQTCYGVLVNCLAHAYQLQWPLLLTLGTFGL